MKKPRLFGSQARIKILQHLFTNNNECYMRELCRELNLNINAVRGELINLKALGIVESKDRDRKIYFKMNNRFKLLPQLRDLVFYEKKLRK